MAKREETYYEECLRLGVPDSIPPTDIMIEDFADELIASHQKTWPQDRRLTVGASEVFSCLRKTWFTKRGHLHNIKEDPEFEQSWGAMERGNIIENHYLVPLFEQGLKRRGLELTMCGEGQDTLFDGIHSATLDGLIPNAPKDFLTGYGVDDILGDSIVVEMKSIDPRITLDYPKPVHEGQVQMQMGMIRDRTEHKPMYAILIYINASWLDDITIFIIKFDEDAYQSGRDRNELVFATTDPAVLMAEGKLDGLCIYCPFERACDKVTEERIPPEMRALTKGQIEKQDVETIELLEPKVEELKRMKKEAKVLDKKIKMANESIKQDLITVNTSRIVGEDWKVSFTSQKGKKSISEELLIEAGLEPEDFKKVGAGFEKLTVS